MKLEEAELDRKVIFTPTKEEGVITSKNDIYVFVRYGNSTYGIATRPEDLSYI